MKIPRKRTLLKIIGLIVFVGVFGVLFVLFRPHYIKGYQTKDGWIYGCSQEVRAKRVKFSFGNDYSYGSDFVPADPADARKYCVQLGIE